MRGLAPLTAVQLLLFLELTSAVPDYSDVKELTGRQGALLNFKRQASPCNPGFFQCPDIFGGGCCAVGRQCATGNCPAMAPGAPDPNAVGGTVVPSAVPTPSAAPTSAAAPTQVTTSAPSQITSIQPTSNVPTSAQTTAPPPSGVTSVATAADQTAGTSPPPSATAVPNPNPPLSGGLSRGAIVGIAFAGVTGAIILGLVLWRAIIGILNPKPKRRKPKKAAMAMAADGGDDGVVVSGQVAPPPPRKAGGPRRIFAMFSSIPKPSIPFLGKKIKSGPAGEAMIPRGSFDDQQPMSQAPGPIGFGAPGGGYQEGAGYMQRNTAFDDQDTSYGGPQRGGDLGYRQVGGGGDVDESQGLFPGGGRGRGGQGGGFEYRQ